MTKKTWYEILPFFYSACGVIAIMFASETTGKISGILLITAAMIIFRLRLEYRKRRAENAEEQLYQTKYQLKQAHKS